ncbi:hypothetical protein SNEBB_005785 [Seison nebaliae]|nr:hypothetical protein SNEBB_005785 [Seison nebaliae]
MILILLLAISAIKGELVSRRIPYYQQAWNKVIPSQLPDPVKRDNSIDSDTTGACANPSTCRYGKCEDIGNGDFICHCTFPRIVGKKCDKLCPTEFCAPCDQNPCYGNAQCINKGNDYQCVCPAGRSGKNCQLGGSVIPATTLLPSSPCQPSPCLNGGNCYPNGAKYFCQCVNGFSGTNCEQGGSSSTPCQPNPCLNGGNCYPNGAKFFCQCVNGFSGTKCEQGGSTSNPCQPNPCLNGGQCYPSGTNAICQCSGLYTGTRCEQMLSVTAGPTDPCLSNPCVNGGSCYNTGGTFICACLQGFQGTRCESSSMIPTTPSQSAACGAGACEAGQTCEQIGVNFFCCQSNLQNCVQPKASGINSCSTLPCLNGGTCIQDVQNDYRCVCNGEFTGRNCQTKESQLSNFCSSSPCQHGSVCLENVPTEFGPTNVCVCAIGYGGEFCERYGCTDGLPCYNNGRCIAVSGQKPYCNCTGNFVGDHCDQIDQCIGRTCANGGNCVNGACICLPSYTGFSCEYVMRDFCKKKPCKSGGTCIQSAPTEPGFCKCPTGIYGLLCDNNPCLPNPCKNLGKCIISGFNSYKCKCGSIYKGKNCQITECFPSTAMVMVEDGMERRIDELKINDHVYSPSTGGSTRIIGWLHYEKNIEQVDYIQLMTVNHTILLSPKHLIATKKISNGNYEYQAANELVENRDRIIGNEIDEVIEIKKLVKETGAFAPLTESGDLMVDGIIVSCYSLVYSHKLAHMALAPARWWYQLSGNTLIDGSVTKERLPSYAEALLTGVMTLPITISSNIVNY